MKQARAVFFLFLFLQFVFICTVVTAQIGPNSTLIQTKNTVEKQDSRIIEIINKAEQHFKNGEESLAVNKRNDAMKEFNAAVDVILNSGLDVRENVKLHNYYYQLIERIYHLEVPRQRIAPSISDAAIVSTAYNGQTLNKDEQQAQVGFGKQDFILSGDPLAQIRLSANRQLSQDKTAQPCKASSPIISKLKLGMTSQQVTSTLKTKLSLLPLRGDYEGIGIMATKIALDRTRFVRLAFYKNRLFYIYILYDNSIKWNNLSEFTSKISDSLKLPNSWRRNSYYEQKLLCNGFSLIAENLAYYSLTLFSIGDINQIFKEQERLRKKRTLINEKRKEAFKP